MAQEVELDPFNRGDTWTNKFTFTDDNNDPIDISNKVYWMTLKLDPEAADIAADAQVSVTATGVDATNGIVYVVFDPTKTEPLVPATYYYDAQEVDGSAVTTIMEGRVKVLRDITQDK
jgi:hypothetical protein